MLLIARNASSLLVVMTIGLAPCSKKNDEAAAARADAAAASSAAAASASAAAAAASASAAAAAAASAALAAKNAAALAKANATLADIQWLVAHNVTSNPAKGGEGDLTSKCDAITSPAPSGARQQGGAGDPDPETQKVLDEVIALCNFDAPLVVATEALDHMKGNPQSQASKLLMCTMAAKECDRARAAKPKDPKLRRVDARRIETCGR